MSEGRILCGNVFPQGPYTTCTNFGISVWSMVLVAVNSALCAASVCDEYKIVFCKKDALLYAFDFALNGRSDLFSIFEIEDHVCDLCIELEVNACILQIFLHRKDQGFVLVIFGEFQGTEIRKSCNVMDETLEVKLHLQSTVPVLKCEHGAPVQPEGRIKYLIIENILDSFVVKILVLCHE